MSLTLSQASLPCYIWTWGPLHCWLSSLQIKIKIGSKRVTEILECIQLSIGCISHFCDAQLAALKKMRGQCSTPSGEVFRFLQQKCIACQMARTARVTTDALGGGLNIGGVAVEQFVGRFSKLRESRTQTPI